MDVSRDAVGGQDSSKSWLWSTPGQLPVRMETPAEKPLVSKSTRSNMVTLYKKRLERKFVGLKRPKTLGRQRGVGESQPEPCTQSTEVVKTAKGTVLPFVDPQFLESPAGVIGEPLLPYIVRSCHSSPGSEILL